MEFEKEQVLEQDNPDGLGTPEPAAEPVESPTTEIPENIPYQRFQEVVGKKNQFEQEAKSYKNQIDLLTQQLMNNQQQNNLQPVTPQEQTYELPKEPRAEDFEGGESDREYLRALNSYDYQMNKIKDAQEQAKVQSENAYKKNYQLHQMRAANFMAQNPDYYTVAEAGPMVKHYPSDMVRAIMASEKSPEVAYHLGKNPSEALRIAQSPYPALEIGKILSKLEVTTSKNVSLAPEPISPLGGNNSALEKIPGRDKMPYKEYKAKMNAQEVSQRKTGRYGR